MSDTADPVLSVALATYNRASFLGTAAERVLAQDFRRFELLIVDDGSSDDTERVARSFQDERVRYIRRPRNGGISAARNTGAEVARAPYLVFLDDDDRPHSDWLSAYSRELETEPGVVSCGVRLVTPEGRPFRTRHPARAADPEPMFLAGTFCIRLEVFRAVGGYREGLQCSHQTELALRVLPYCRNRNFAMRSIERPLIDIVREDGPGRRERSPEKLLAGTLEILHLHAPALPRRVRANYLAVAGVAAARLGDYSQARRLFRQALAADPREWRHAGRMISASLPIAARRLWGTAGR